MRPLLPLAAAATLALVLVSPVLGAEHPTRHGSGCDGDKQRPDGCLCPDYSTELTIPTEREGYFIYVVVDEVASNGFLFSVWLYHETNGVPGLQRHDDYCTDRLDMEDSERDAGWPCGYC